MRSINMEQAYWERHQQADGDSNYYGEGRWVGINQRIDSFLRSILGNFHWEPPTRNWLGPGREGNWVKFGDFDDRYIIPLAAVMTFSLIWIYANTTFKDIIIYLVMATGVAVWAAINKQFPASWFECFGSGYTQDAKRNIIIGILLGLVFIFISILVSLLSLGQIVGFTSLSTEPTIVFITTWIVAPLTLFLFIPYIENLTLGCFFVPSLARYWGIIPSTLIMSIGTAALHLAIYYRDYSNPIPYVLISILYGLIVYPVQLAYHSKLVGWTAHSEVNIVAYLMKIIKI